MAIRVLGDDDQKLGGTRVEYAIRILEFPDKSVNADSLNEAVIPTRKYI